MLYVHSFSPIEQALFSALAQTEELIQVQTLKITDRSILASENLAGSHKTLLYSFQDLTHYRHIDSFREESAAVDMLIEYILEQAFTKIILITYPGAYFNSTNLFLQYKGLLEQKFIHTGIPCTILNVQAIHEPYLKINNLHSLFYNESAEHCVIPTKSSCITYSIKLNSLCQIIVKSLHGDYEGKFDAFDTVFDLKTYLLTHSSVDQVRRMTPIYLYVKSFFGWYASPTMLELFLMTIVPMYKFRIEKEFGITLEQENSGIPLSYNRNLITFSEPSHSILKSLIPIE
jgi:hypothetical protein